VIRDAGGEGTVSASGEIDGPAHAMLGLKELQNLLIVGEAGGVERGKLGDSRLDVGFSACKPARKLEEAGWLVAQENAQRVEQSIGFDQGAVEVHAERDLRSLGCGEAGGGCGQSVLVSFRGLLDSRCGHYPCLV